MTHCAASGLVSAILTLSVTTLLECILQLMFDIDWNLHAELDKTPKTPPDAAAAIVKL